MKRGNTGVPLYIGVVRLTSVVPLLLLLLLLMRAAAAAAVPMLYCAGAF